MGTPQIFNYDDANITFTDENGNVFVNATEMAKPFGKKPADWLRTNQTKDFLEALEIHLSQKNDSHFANMRTENSENELKFFKMELVKVQNGGAYPGTWFHEDVALEFARWLSPAFAIWCNDRIKEIIRNQAVENVQTQKQPDFDEMLFRYVMENFKVQFKIVSKEHAEHVRRVRSEAGRKGGLKSGEVRNEGRS